MVKNVKKIWNSKKSLRNINIGLMWVFLSGMFSDVMGNDSYFLAFLILVFTEWGDVRTYSIKALRIIFITLLTLVMSYSIFGKKIALKYLR